MERKEYLQRPLINGVVYEIQEDRIRISSPDSLFINITKDKEIPLPEVKRLFRELKKIAKTDSRIKLKGVTKFLPTIRALHVSYMEGRELVEKNFSDIGELCRLIQKEGLHIGCVHDELLQAAFDKSHEIERLHYRNSEYFRFIQCYATLRNAVQKEPWKTAGMISYTVHLLS